MTPPDIGSLWVQLDDIDTGLQPWHVRRWIDDEQVQAARAFSRKRSIRRSLG
jgi:hypothetical protein